MVVLQPNWVLGQEQQFPAGLLTVLLVIAEHDGVHGPAKHGPTGAGVKPGSTGKSGGGATGVTEFELAVFSEFTPYGVSSLTTNV